MNEMTTTEALESMFARYVACSLPLPAQVLISAHLSIRDDNRSLVAGLEQVASGALEEIEPFCMSERDRRLEAVFASHASVSSSEAAHHGDMVMPDVLADFVGYRLQDIPWRTKMPGFREFDIGEFDGCHASMFWIKPGRTIPAHTHGGMELSLVLDGAFTDVLGRFGRGDISIADEHVDHRPVADKSGPCIGFAVVDAPLKLTGSLTQRIGDILGY